MSGDTRQTDEAQNTHFKLNRMNMKRKEKVCKQSHSDRNMNAGYSKELPIKKKNRHKHTTTTNKLQDETRNDHKDRKK